MSIRFREIASGVALAMTTMHTKTVAASNRFVDVQYDIHFTPNAGL
jgi:hypothetical protein